MFMSLFSFSHFLVSFFLFKKFSGLCLFLFSAVSYSLCLDPSFLKYSCVFMLRVISFMYTKSGEMWKAYRTGLSLFIVLLLQYFYCNWCCCCYCWCCCCCYCWSYCYCWSCCCWQLLLRLKLLYNICVALIINIVIYICNNSSCKIYIQELTTGFIYKCKDLHINKRRYALCM